MSDLVTNRIIKTLFYTLDAKTKKEILNNIGLSDRYNNLKDNILPAIEAGLISKTITDMPTSGNQKYITTEKGRKLIGK